MAKARICFSRVPSTAIPVRSWDGGCKRKGKKSVFDPLRASLGPTHQHLRVYQVKGYRQIGNHTGESDVMARFSPITENVREDSNESRHAARQLF